MLCDHITQQLKWAIRSQVRGDVDSETFVGLVVGDATMQFND